MSRRVLVTGGAGFIGSHVAQRLHSLGWDTHVLDSLATGDQCQPVELHFYTFL